LVPGIDTENSWESFPVVTDDELTIYFLAYGASGDPWEMWVASRPSREVPFGDVHPLVSLNTEAAEAPTWVSPDGCRFYFERCTVGTWDPTNATFVAERIRPSE
jgi:hypothetical protein